MKISFNPAPASHRGRRAGMSLLETMIAMSIAALVMAGVGSVTIFTARSFLAMGNYADLDDASRTALDVLSRDVRQARAVTAYSSHQITLLANDNSTLTYSYSPSTSQFTRKTATSTTVLLEQCDFLHFNVYQRNPSNNWTWYPVQSDVSTAKLIDVSWKCSRKILGEKVNTESVQTAKIVIRN
ncbi:MAG: prepilin-type N-terminal cleavage/methylation domain-containing protein [Verrucomicrobia bacterium]|nr:prepilin-type N-terminal cleavage/methylation domain-containing protein [Verrucomicrobiota bacterium]